MPVRLRITLLFQLLVAIIFGLACFVIFIWSVNTRQNQVYKRLLYRAQTTARLLGSNSVINRELAGRVDSLTRMLLQNKVVQAYNHKHEMIYVYKENRAEPDFTVDKKVLEDVVAEDTQFFTVQGKEAVAYHYTDDNARMIVVAAAEDKEGHDSLAELQRILIVSFLAGNLIILAAGYLFARRLIKPVEKITNDVAEISAHNLVRRLRTGTAKDEWHQLASTLNELLNRLQESFDMQRRFIANASHEMSTPLTSISSQLEVALQRDRSPEEYRAVIQSTYQDVRHMGKLTHTLLEFAKASGNAGGLELSPVRIDEIILEMPAQLAKISPAYSALITFDNLPEEEEQLLVYGNHPLLETAIRNIVVNACKYSPDHQAIIRLRSDKNNILIAVEDHGEGISPEEQKTIFQPFYRGSSEVERTTEGFGLGLPLSNRIIRLHKGEITLESTPKKGSVFLIRLPVSPKT